MDVGRRKTSKRRRRLKRKQEEEEHAKKKIKRPWESRAQGAGDGTGKVDRRWERQVVAL